MKERPILFSAPMVRALLAGTKTMTRRIVKPQPVIPHEKNQYGEGGWTHYMGTPWHDFVLPVDGGFYESATASCKRKCPYGQPGDRLWVRETWDFLPDGDRSAMIRYWADGSEQRRVPPADFNPMIYGKERQRPSIHMPRWASRLTLEITGVRVERLQGISEEDCLAEGIPRSVVCPACNNPDEGCCCCDHSGRVKVGDGSFVTARGEYRTLWESINGHGSWDANPWVWVVAFKRVDP